MPSSFESLRILCFLFCTSIAGCAFTSDTPPDIRTEHRPFHPKNNQQIELLLSVQDDDGLSHIELHVFEWNLKPGSVLPEVEIREGGKWGLEKQWVPTTVVKDFEESYTLNGFAPNTELVYKVTAKDRKGAVATESVVMAVGDWPYPDQPILLWGDAEPTSERSIAICFLPDGDYIGDHTAFLEDVQDFLYRGYFENELIRDNRDLWDFYYAPIDVDSEALILPPGASDWLDVTVTAFGFVHRESFDDQAVGTNFSIQRGEYGTLIHETAHSVFDLSDEYTGEGPYSQLSDYPNVFDNQSDCEAYRESHGKTPSTCDGFSSESGAWYLPEYSQDNCLMRSIDESVPGEFAWSCRKRVLWYYEQLSEGN